MEIMGGHGGYQLNSEAHQLLVLADVGCCVVVVCLCCVVVIRVKCVRYQLPERSEKLLNSM